jgi:hypothetical protein
VAAVTASAGGAGGDGNGTGAEPPGGPHGHLRPPLLPVPLGAPEPPVNRSGAGAAVAAAQESIGEPVYICSRKLKTNS